MNVLFVSNSKHKANKTTQKILDRFAKRIGQNTWQTCITQEGLKSIRILLNQYSSKHMSVACYKTARDNNKLLWIVGNRNNFDENGNYAIHYTKQNILYTDNKWPYLELIKIVTALSSLFHDMGKATSGFQDMLKGNTVSNEIRHEYISLCIFASIVKNILQDIDNKLSQDELNVSILQELVNMSFSNNTETIIQNVYDIINTNETPFLYLPTKFLKTIGWMIYSHHAMPDFSNVKESLTTFADVFNKINTPDMSKIANDKIMLNKGIPVKEGKWLSLLIKWCSRGIKYFSSNNIENVLSEQFFYKHIGFLGLLCLIVGDHEASLAHERDPLIYSDMNILPAKGYSIINGCLCTVSINDHCIAVLEKSLQICAILPYLHEHMPHVSWDESFMRTSSDPFFIWQDTAYKKIRKAVENTGANQGFLGINMASTGTGKTTANAKILSAVAGNNFRCVFSVGLRTLTLQIGDEYRYKVGFDETEMAVVVGSKTVADIHNKQKKIDDDIEESILWTDNSVFVDYKGSIVYDKLTTKIKDNRTRNILYAPVLVTTIDHIISASENTKRGRQVLGLMRLLSSDIVIDEVDSFSLSDTVAILRLVHLAGVFGRRVIVSSATIPQKLSQSLYHAYYSGWQLYAESMSVSKDIMTAFVDEYNTSIRPCDQNTFMEMSDNFYNKRIQRLQTTSSKHRFYIFNVDYDNVYKQLLNESIFLHDNNYECFKNKKISCGLIRVANIKDCVNVVHNFLNMENLENYSIKIIPYHSRFPLIARHYIENNLDVLLQKNKKDNERREMMLDKLCAETEKKNVIVIVVATPVEESGRDHSFDWGIFEPSSIRSIIQASGRVRRHDYDFVAHQLNIGIMNKNFKSLNGYNIAYGEQVFGYEDKINKLSSSNLCELLSKYIDKEDENGRYRFDTPINSIWRIQRINMNKMKPADDFLHLEHYKIEAMFKYNNPENYNTVAGYTQGVYFLTNKHQSTHQFRKSNGNILSKFISKNEEGMLIFKNSDNTQDNLLDKLVIQTDDEVDPNNRLFLNIDYDKINELYNLDEDKFWQIDIPEYLLSNYSYHIYFNMNLGLYVF